MFFNCKSILESYILNDIFCLGHDSEPEDNKGDEINMLTEEDKRIAEMGRPQLGEIARLEVKIMESSEFKVSTFKQLLYCSVKVCSILPTTSLSTIFISKWKYWLHFSGE